MRERKVNGCFANNEDNIWPDRRHKFVSCRIFGSLLTRLGLIPVYLDVYNHHDYTHPYIFIPASIRERTQHCADVEVCTAILDLRIYIGSCSHVVC